MMRRVFNIVKSACWLSKKTQSQDGIRPLLVTDPSVPTSASSTAGQTKHRLHVTCSW